NYPILAEAGINIHYNHSVLFKTSKKTLKVHTQLNNDIAVLKLFPGISEAVVSATLQIKNLKAVIIETFGAGNASTQQWFIGALKEAVKKGIVILNITQCNEGKVIQGMYETSANLKKIGVIGGEDLTFESAVTKLMFLLGQKLTHKQIISALQQNLRGELSKKNENENL